MFSAIPVQTSAETNHPYNATTCAMDLVEQVKQLSARRIPVNQISEITGLHRSTIYRWRRQRYRPALAKPRRRIDGRLRLTPREAQRIITTIRTRTPRNARYGGQRPSCMDRETWDVPSIRAILLDRYPNAAETYYTHRVLGRWLHSQGLVGTRKRTYR